MYEADEVRQYCRIKRNVSDWRAMWIDAENLQSPLQSEEDRSCDGARVNRSDTWWANISADEILTVFENRLALAHQTVSLSMQNALGDGSSLFEAFLTSQPAAVELARSYIDVFIVSTCMETLLEMHKSRKCRGSSSIRNPYRIVLKALIQLYCFNRINETLGSLVSHNIISLESGRTLPDAIQQLCGFIAPHAMAIVGTYDIPDSLLRSPLAGKATGYVSALLDMITKGNTHYDQAATARL